MSRGILILIILIELGVLIGGACGPNGPTYPPREYEMPHAWCYVGGAGVSCVPK